jgi:transaldolase
MAMNLRVKIFADGANLEKIADHALNPLVKGFTTNPTLMAKAGIKNYRTFAKDALDIIGPDKSISFEVFADSHYEMLAQACEIATWGPNVYVKIPVMTTDGTPTYDLIKELAKSKVKQNVTAIFTTEQITRVSEALGSDTPAIVSVFAGRIGDAGGNVAYTMQWASTFLSFKGNQELLWASPRQVYDVVLASEYGTKIITVTDEILKKIPALGKSLHQFSQETVQMFYNDAQASGFSL